MRSHGLCPICTLMLCVRHASHVLDLWLQSGESFLFGLWLRNSMLTLHSSCGASGSSELALLCNALGLLHSSKMGAG